MVETMPRMSSTLNPNAPLYVPASYLATDDFSPEWWHLMQTSPVFWDYWLTEGSGEIIEEEDSPLDDSDDLDIEGLLEMVMQCEESENADSEQGNGAARNIEMDVLSALAVVVNLNQSIWRDR